MTTKPKYSKFILSSFHCEIEKSKKAEKIGKRKEGFHRAKDETQGEETRVPFGQRRETLRFVDPRYAITHYVHKQGACSKEGMTTG